MRYFDWLPALKNDELDELAREMEDLKASINNVNLSDMAESAGFFVDAHVVADLLDGCRMERLRRSAANQAILDRDRKVPDGAR